MTDSGRKGVTARQRRASGGRRNSVHVRLSDHELELVAAKAQRLRVSVPNLLVQSALHGGAVSLPERHALYRELSALRLELIRIGTNVNQLARWANATDGEVGAQAGSTLKAAHDAMRRTDAVLAALPVPPSRAHSRPTGEVPK